MKAKIKVTIGDNVYEAESTYESGIETAVKTITIIVDQEIRLMECKHKLDNSAK
jgi:hypothetical protein